jgi:hypothetical protein
MAYLFDISQSDSKSLQVKPKQPVDRAFQVKNVSGRRIHTRIYMKEGTDITKNTWATIKGQKELLVDIEPGVVQSVTVTINPPQSATAGKSTFYLYAQDTDQPDEGDKSPAVSVEVLPQTGPTTPPWVIPVVVVVVLIVVGLGSWLIYDHFKGGGDATTDTTGKTTTAAKVQVPGVVGRPLGDAQAMLGFLKFTNVKLVPNVSGGTSTPGLVYGQDPAPSTPVALTDPISLWFVPTAITVPQDLIGKDLGSALAILQANGLQYGGICCPSSANAPQLVIRTDPGVGQNTAVGQKVVLYTTNPIPTLAGGPPVATVASPSVTALQSMSTYRQKIETLHFDPLLIAPK